MGAGPPSSRERETASAATAARVHSGRGSSPRPPSPLPPRPVHWPFPRSGPDPRFSPPDAPAVDHDGPGVHGVERLHLLQELEHPDGGEGHPEVGPAGEVQLGHEPRGFAAVRELLPGHRGVSGGRPAPPRRLPGQPGARGRACGAGPVNSGGTPFTTEASACCLPGTHRAAWGPGEVGSGPTGTSGKPAYDSRPHW